jgi:Zn-dependent protease with chaperone function
MSHTVNSLRTTKEKSYNVIMIAVGAVLWVLIAWGLWAAVTSNSPEIATMANGYLSYAIAIWIFYMLAAAVYRATAFGNMLLLGPEQFPQLHDMVVAGARALKLDKTPQTFLYNSQGIFNAFARRLMGGRYVFLTSALVEANSDEQVRFVIGHELGHHAAGHLDPWINSLKLPAHAVPFLGRAYSRSREYSCDNIGAYLSRDIAASRSSLQMLGCGCRRLNPTMSCEAFMAQEKMVPPIFGFLSEIFRSHPRLTGVWRPSRIMAPPILILAGIQRPSRRLNRKTPSLRACGGVHDPRCRDHHSGRLPGGARATA